MGKLAGTSWQYVSAMHDYLDGWRVLNSLHMRLLFSFHLDQDVTLMISLLDSVL